MLRVDFRHDETRAETAKGACPAPPAAPHPTNLPVPPAHVYTYLSHIDRLWSVPVVRRLQTRLTGPLPPPIPRRRTSPPTQFATFVCCTRAHGLHAGITPARWGGGAHSSWAGLQLCVRDSGVRACGGCACGFWDAAWGYMYGVVRFLRASSAVTISRVWW